MMEQRCNEIYRHISIYLTMLTTTVFSPPYTISERSMNMCLYRHSSGARCIWFLYGLAITYTIRKHGKEFIGNYKYAGVGPIKSNIGYQIMYLYVLSR